MSDITAQQEQEQIERAERSRDCCRGKCTTAKAAQALLSLHGRLEACEESRLRWNRKWSEANDELTEARKAISESDMLRSLAYSERDEARGQLEMMREAFEGLHRITPALNICLSLCDVAKAIRER